MDANITVYQQRGSNWEFRENFSDYVEKHKIVVRDSNITEVLKDWAKDNGLRYEFYNGRHVLIENKIPMNAAQIEEAKRKD